MSRLNNNVTNIYAPTEFDLEGQCPYCGETVFSYSNKQFCGSCGKKITWETDKNEILFKEER